MNEALQTNATITELYLGSEDEDLQICVNNHVSPFPSFLTENNIGDEMKHTIEATLSNRQDTRIMLHWD